MDHSLVSSVTERAGEAAPYPHLFSPFTLAGHRLRNRVAHLAITTSLSQGGQVTDRLIQYHANRARGGTAMIIAEPINMPPHQKVGAKVDAGSDQHMDGLKRWADAVESHDCRLIAQVQDAGRGRHAPGRNPDAVGASPLPDDISWTVPHAMTAGEIGVMVEGFAEACARVKRCGFSGVEISAGHGHLFHQFMSPWSNVRDDEYGGAFAGRMRLTLELMAAIRAACGRDFILGVKLPGNDGVSGGIGPELAGEIAQCVAATGHADYICFAQGSHHRSLEMHTPDGHTPPLTYRGLMQQLRPRIGNIPLMALGRITDPAEAEGLLSHGEAELIGLGRPLITDPAWPRKAAAGRARDIRYCVSGNSCWHAVISHRPIACDNNPRVAEVDELDEVTPTAHPRRIVVVGGGIAGLEAAWVAATRGHQVTLFGRSAELGGKLRLISALPGGEQFTSIYDYQQVAAEKAGVRFVLGAAATSEGILALAPDAVILATGSAMIWPRCLPAELQADGFVQDLRSALPDLLRVQQRQPGTAVLFDMDHTDGTYAAAELLHRIFEHVVLVTPRDSIAQDTYLVTRQGILRRFHQLGIEIRLHSEPHWSATMEEGVLEITNVYTGQRSSIENVAFFAFSSPRAAENALVAPLRLAGIDVLVIGDAKVARSAMAATAEGHAAGRAV
ncbi:MAG: oxidoreductase [Rubritepida sp.]|nr:oxidoreductase [Rubritepida sp.]